MDTPLNQFNLKDKVAVVTGSRRGIGRALAVGLAQAGAKIISMDRTEPKETRNKISDVGGRHDWKKVDLQEASTESFNQTIDQVCEENGRVDVLVNNAGICPRYEALSFPLEEWERTLKINLTAAWLLSQAVARKMILQGKGKIINIASMLSFQGGVQAPAYAASKHGILAVTRALANELAAQGINVNAIAPGYIQTELTADISNDTHRNKGIINRIPAGHWGRPEDIVGTCIFLASSASDYIHGTCIPVDGGWLSQ